MAKCVVDRKVITGIVYYDRQGKPYCEKCANDSSRFVCPACGLTLLVEERGTSGNFCIHCEESEDVD